MNGSIVINVILEREGLKAGTFAKSIGVTPTQVYDLRDGRTKNITPKIAEKIKKVYPHYAYSWLLSGEGDITNDEIAREVKKKNEDESFLPEEYNKLQDKYYRALEELKAVKNQAEPMNPNAVLYVPLVNQYAHAGYLNGYQNDTYMTTLPTIPFIADHEARGNYIAFEVKGDSMNDGTEDSYLEGDRLLCREVPQHLWVDSKLHIKKWDFVIVHEEGIIVKRIIDHDIPNHTITVHSLNDMYPDRVIDLAEVKQIFNVVEMQRPRRR